MLFPNAAGDSLRLNLCPITIPVSFIKFGLRFGARICDVSVREPVRLAKNVADRMAPAGTPTGAAWSDF